MTRSVVRFLTVVAGLAAFVTSAQAACSTNGQMFIYGTAVTGTPDGNQQDLRINDGTVDFANCGTNWVKVSTVHGGAGQGYQIELGYLLMEHSDFTHHAHPFTEIQDQAGATMHAYNGIVLTFNTYYTFKEVHVNGSSSKDYDLYYSPQGGSFTYLTTYTTNRNWLDVRGETERRGSGTAGDHHNNMRWRDSSGVWHSNWTPAVSVGAIPGYHFNYIATDQYSIVSD